ncbi:MULTISPECIES: hypothetical protein [unclassified Paludibacterium]|nr:hypothetical protein [Paludibacterium sp. B53371]
MMLCRGCGHALSYAVMSAEVREAMDGAVRLIHLRVARKLMDLEKPKA